MQQEQGQAKTQQGQSFSQRFKHTLGYYFYSWFPAQATIMLPLSVYHISKKLGFKNRSIAGIFLINQIIQQFAKKSEIYYKIFQYLEPHKYFKGFNVHYESPLESEKVLLPVQPHSIMAMALQMQMYRKDEPISNSVFCGSRVALQMPFGGYFMRWQGLIGADPKNFQNLMKEGKNVCFIPGGFEEASLTSDKQYNLYIDHKGFIKYAMQFGYKIRPCFAYNENKAFNTIDKFYKFRILLNKFKMAGTFFFSKYFFFFANPNISIELVVGNPFIVPHIENPTKEQVEEWHKKYIEYVDQLYNKYKKKYDSQAGELHCYKDGQIVQMIPKL